MKPKDKQKDSKHVFSPKVVQDSVQELLLLVPQIKSNISDAIAMVPEVVFVSSSELLRSLSSNACNPFEHGSFFVGASRRRRTYKCGAGEMWNVQVKSQLKEKLKELPTQEELQKKADSFIAQLPKYKVTFIS